MTEPRFEVGELAIAINWNGTGGRYNGQDVEVVAPLAKRDLGVCENGCCRVVAVGYVVRTPDGELWGAEPCRLRKKLPPEPPGSWENVARIAGWKPSRSQA